MCIRDSGTVGIFARNIIIGGLSGGLALIVGLLLGICLLYTSNLHLKTAYLLFFLCADTDISCNTHFSGSLPLRVYGWGCRYYNYTAAFPILADSVMYALLAFLPIIGASLFSAGLLYLLRVKFLCHISQKQTGYASLICRPHFRISHNHGACE